MLSKALISCISDILSNVGFSCFLAAAMEMLCLRIRLGINVMVTDLPSRPVIANLWGDTQLHVSWTILNIALEDSTSLGVNP